MVLAQACVALEQAEEEQHFSVPLAMTDSVTQVSLIAAIFVLISVLIAAVLVVFQVVVVRPLPGTAQPMQPLENSHLDHVLQQQILTMQQAVIN